MEFVTTLIAQAAPSPGGSAGMTQFLMIGLMFAAFWFLIIAPQRKKQKQHAQMIAELKSGAEVLTSGGIYGTITNVKDDRFVLKIAENTKIEVLKSAVSSVVSKAE